MNPKIAKFLKNTEKFVSDNSPSLLTALGVAGTITTAVLAGRAGYKAGIVVANVNRDDGSIPRNPEDIAFLNTQEKFLLTWKYYIPPVLTGVGTIAAIIMSNQVSNKRAAALAAAYSLSEKAYAEYKDKVVERLGSDEATAIRDEIAQDRVNRAEKPESIVVMGDSKVRCFEAYTGRYFYSTAEDLRRAENEVNKNVLHDGYASLSDFYSLIDLPHTSTSDEIGWNSDELLHLEFSSTIGPEDIPTLVIDFSVLPIRDYQRFH